MRRTAILFRKGAAESDALSLEIELADIRAYRRQLRKTLDTAERCIQQAIDEKHYEDSPTALNRAREIASALRLIVYGRA